MGNQGTSSAPLRWQDRGVSVSGADRQDWAECAVSWRRPTSKRQGPGPFVPRYLFFLSRRVPGFAVHYLPPTSPVCVQSLSVAAYICVSHPKNSHRAEHAHRHIPRFNTSRQTAFASPVYSSCQSRVDRLTEGTFDPRQARSRWQLRLPASV